jgi:hypothetical protein
MSVVRQKLRPNVFFGEYALLKDSCNASPAKNFSSPILGFGQALRAGGRCGSRLRNNYSLDYNPKLY